MEQRITFITLGVNNLDDMKRFYNTVFGWEPMKDSDGIVFYKTGSMIFGLFPARELAGDIGIPDAGTGFKRMTLAINLLSEQEVDDAYRVLTAKGAKPVKPPENVFWGGYRGYVADPEDNYWEIAYNPFLRLDARGNVLSHE